MEETEDVSLGDKMCFFRKACSISPIQKPPDVTVVVINRIRIKW